MRTSGPIHELQRQHESAIEELLRRLGHRLEEIRSQLCEACKADRDMQAAYRETWKPRFEKIHDAILRLQRLSTTRQSLFVMGKRGQGKTSLLRRWIGQGIRGPLGQEPLPLPTGTEETTCCLVRLTAVKASTNDDYLQVDLLPPDVLTDVEPRPNRPPVESVLVSRAVSPTLPPESPFFVLRYPVKNKDDRIYLTRTGHTYTLSEKGDMPLTTLQYYASEVTVSLELSNLDSHARQLLQVLDIVDAPGADPAAKGEYAEWVRHKNRVVIRRGMDRLDLLLLVCSAQTAAINLSAQVQEDVLKPWVKRCKDHPHGRLLLAITHSAELLDEAKHALERGRSANGGGHSIARKLVGNILEPLAAVREGGISLFELAGNVRNWPPIFFLEEKLDRLEQYRLCSGANPSTAITTKLLSLLSKPPHRRIENLPLGEACIMHIVNDWGEQFPEWPAEKVRRVQEWLIRALTSLLDPNDNGLQLLTEFVCNWAITGPMAENHAEERHEAVEELQDLYLSLLQDLNQPDYKSTIDELQKVRSELQHLWTQHASTMVFNLGDSCRARLLQAEKNRGPKLEERQEFSLGDVLDDLIHDTVKQLLKATSTNQSSSLAQQDRHQYRVDSPLVRALRHCLHADYPLTELAHKYQGRFSNDRENLARIQAVGFERIVRILDHLANADADALSDIARYCYGQDIRQSELLRPFYQQYVAPFLSEDKVVFDAAIAKGSEHLEGIRKSASMHAYE